MSAPVITPECQLDMCQLCAGTRAVRRQGAPDWEAPLFTLRCDHTCHGRRRPATPDQREASR